MHMNQSQQVQEKPQMKYNIKELQVMFLFWNDGNHLQGELEIVLSGSFKIHVSPSNFLHTLAVQSMSTEKARHQERNLGHNTWAVVPQSLI